jgi:hypothetical protein
VIHYHGGPITPVDAAIKLWTARHAFVSFEHPSQAPIAAEVCQSFAFDCGAFSKWKAGEGVVDVAAYADWVRQYSRHPGLDFAIIPDVIDGTELDNDKMISSWFEQRVSCASVPVWHLHESLGRLSRLVRCVQARVYPCIALGSSGQWSTPGTDAWWERMEEVRPVVCDELGRPLVKLHGLRMLSPTIFSHIPLASADSTNVGQNVGIDKKWTGAYPPLTAKTRALVLAERIENHVAAVTWSRRVGIQQNLELLG